MALPDTQAIDDLAAFVSLGRTDKEAVLRHLSSTERATLERRLLHISSPRSSTGGLMRSTLARFSPVLRRTLRRALTDPAHKARITPATQRTLQALLSSSQTFPGGAA